LEKGDKAMKTANGILKLVLAIGLIFAVHAKAQAQSRAFEAINIGTVSELNSLSSDSPVKAVGQRNGRAFVFVEGETTPRTMPLVPGDPTNASSNATGISPDGSEAVGVSASRPTDWPNPVGPSNPGHYPDPVGLACWDFGVPVALNNSRVAVGSCGRPFDGVPLTTPLLFSAAAGQLTRAEIPSGFFGGKALGINNAGIAVGQIINSQAAKLAAIWTNTNAQPLTLALPGGAPEARGISNGSIFANNPDLITMVGQYPDPAGIPRQRGWTFLFANGAPSLLSTTRIPFFNVALPPNSPSYYIYLVQPFNAAETRRINRSGTSVGFARQTNGNTKAALWNLAGTFADLTANTSGLPLGTVLTDAVDINDQGYVLAKGLVNGVLQGFLLRPTIVPITFSAGY
jgi:hypothetical protein